MIRCKIIKFYPYRFNVTDNWDYSTVRQRRALLTTPRADDWIVISGLLPYSRYSVQVNATNSVGYVISNVVSYHQLCCSMSSVRWMMLSVIWYDVISNEV